MKNTSNVKGRLQRKLKEKQDKLQPQLPNQNAENNDIRIIASNLTKNPEYVNFAMHIKLILDRGEQASINEKDIQNLQEIKEFCESQSKTIRRALEELPEKNDPNLKMFIKMLMALRSAYAEAIRNQKNEKTKDIEKNTAANENKIDAQFTENFMKLLAEITLPAPAIRMDANRLKNSSLKDFFEQLELDRNMQSLIKETYEECMHSRLFMEIKKHIREEKWPEAELLARELVQNAEKTNNAISIGLLIYTYILLKNVDFLTPMKNKNSGQVLDKLVEACKYHQTFMKHYDQHKSVSMKNSSDNSTVKEIYDIDDDSEEATLGILAIELSEIRSNDIIERYENTLKEEIISKLELAKGLLTVNPKKSTVVINVLLSLIKEQEKHHMPLSFNLELIKTSLSAKVDLKAIEKIINLFHPEKHLPEPEAAQIDTIQSSASQGNASQSQAIVNIPKAEIASNVLNVEDSPPEIANTEYFEAQQYQYTHQPWDFYKKPKNSVPKAVFQNQWLAGEINDGNSTYYKDYKSKSGKEYRVFYKEGLISNQITSGCKIDPFNEILKEPFSCHSIFGTHGIKKLRPIPGVFKLKGKEILINFTHEVRINHGQQRLLMFEIPANSEGGKPLLVVSNFRNNGEHKGARSIKIPKEIEEALLQNTVVGNADCYVQAKRASGEAPSV